MNKIISFNKYQYKYKKKLEIQKANKTRVISIKNNIWSQISNKLTSDILIDYELHIVSIEAIKSKTRKPKKIVDRPLLVASAPNNSTQAIIINNTTIIYCTSVGYCKKYIEYSTKVKRNKGRMNMDYFPQ